MQTKAFIGCSSKSYFTAAAAGDWFRSVGAALQQEPGGGDGVFLCTSFPLIPAAISSLDPLGVNVGAQDVSMYPPGAYTGEVSAELLAELGARYVMVGHPERSRYLGETARHIAEKVRVTVEAGMVPILIVGEPERDADPESVMGAQLRAAFEGIPLSADVIVAYEPTWAIGQAEPAPPAHVVSAVARLREMLAGRTGSAFVLYGGSAGPGTFEAIARHGNETGQTRGIPDGVFLGRGGLDPESFMETVREVRLATAPAGQDRSVDLLK